MKKYLLVFVLIFLVNSVFAEEFKQDTLADTSINGYISIENKFSYINDQFAIINGIKLAFIIDHSWVIGGGMWMLSNIVYGNGSYSGNELDLAYGGLWLEYIFLSEQIIHFSIGMTSGVGLGSFTNITKDPSNFFILEPELHVIFNIAKNFRLELGVGYRYIAGVKMAGTSNEDLRGITGNVILKFGSF